MLHLTRHLTGHLARAIRTRRHGAHVTARRHRSHTRSRSTGWWRPHVTVGVATRGNGAHRAGRHSSLWCHSGTHRGVLRTGITRTLRVASRWGWRTSRHRTHTRWGRARSRRRRHSRLRLHRGRLSHAGSRWRHTRLLLRMLPNTRSRRRRHTRPRRSHHRVRISWVHRRSTGSTW